MACHPVNIFESEKEQLSINLKFIFQIYKHNKITKISSKNELALMFYCEHNFKLPKKSTSLFMIPKPILLECCFTIFSIFRDVRCCSPISVALICYLSASQQTSICSKSTIDTIKKLTNVNSHRRRSGVFEHISYLLLVSIVDFELVNVCWEARHNCRFTLSQFLAFLNERIYLADSLSK